MKAKRVKADRWTPFVQVAPNKDVKPKTENAVVEYFQNSRYFVSRDQFFHDDERKRLAFAVLSIRRRDRRSEFPWRDLQRIKNELLGREIDALELLPAEARLVDTANQRYLWFVPSMPSFGFAKREVTERSIGGSYNSPFAAEHRPNDLMDEATLASIEQRVLIPEDYATVLTRVVTLASKYLDKIPGAPSEGSVLDRLAALLPDGVDVEDDNVVAFATKEGRG